METYVVPRRGWKGGLGVFSAGGAGRWPEGSPSSPVEERSSSGETNEQRFWSGHLAPRRFEMEAGCPVAAIGVTGAQNALLGGIFSVGGRAERPPRRRWQVSEIGAGAGAPPMGGGGGFGWRAGARDWSVIVLPAILPNRLLKSVRRRWFGVWGCEVAGSWFRPARPAPAGGREKRSHR